ncbi:MAG: hypothetical protein IGQ88_01600 [Gloeomargaritaceae cyanobacterium C42_A2020_066]|nr:hypothetical protein [Gloeomargaritaceae cyanobacterium C42_A2020_066]
MTITWGERLWVWLNRLLLAALGVVFLGLGWFAVALAGQSFHLPLGLNLWYRLWQPLFQPAIGLVMLGALSIGVGGWLRQRFQRPDA